MNYKKITPQKIRSRLVRKGFFTQLPMPEFMPHLRLELEGQTRLYRTMLDHTLFDATSKEHSVRKDALKQINPDSSCINDFNAMCSNAIINPDKARTMMLNLLDNYFSHVFTETSCSFHR